MLALPLATGQPAVRYINQFYHISCMNKEIKGRIGPKQLIKYRVTPTGKLYLVNELYKDFDWVEARSHSLAIAPD